MTTLYMSRNKREGTYRGYRLGKHERFTGGKWTRLCSYNNKRSKY